MTQVLDAPGALARVDDVPQQPKRPQGIGQRGIVLNTFDDVWRLSVAFAKSGLAPKGIQTPEAIFTAVQLGLELGLSPMSALQSIAVVNGRPSIYGDAALALVRGSGLCEFYTEFASNDAIHAIAEQLAVSLEYGEVDETKKFRRQIADLGTKMNRTADDFGYTSISKRVGGINSVVRRFTLADARKASLKGKAGPWVQYEERMLMWRSRGFNLRDNFGDVLRGMYTAEEAADIPGGTTQVSSFPIAAAAESLAHRLTKRPVSEGQTFEPDANAAAAVQQEQAEPVFSASTGEAIEQTAPANETLPPEAGEMLAQSLSQDWDSAKRVILDAAKEQGGYPASEATKAMAAHIKLKLAKAGKESSITLAERTALYEAFRSSRINLAGEIAPE